MAVHVIDDETRRFGRLLHYAGVLALVVCMAAAYSLVHAPTKEEVAWTAARVEELRLSLENAPLAHEHHRRVSDKLRKVTDRILQIERRVPEHADAGEFLKEVTQLAYDEKLEISDFSPEQPEKRAGYAEMQVALSGRGSFASICTFLHRLAQLNRLSKVKDLHLTASDGANEYPMTATLVIYFGLQGSAREREGHRG